MTLKLDLMAPPVAVNGPVLERHLPQARQNHWLQEMEKALLAAALRRAEDAADDAGAGRALPACGYGGAPAAHAAGRAAEPGVSAVPATPPEERAAAAARAAPPVGPAMAGAAAQALAAPGPARAMAARQAAPAQLPPPPPTPQAARGDHQGQGAAVAQVAPMAQVAPVQANHAAQAPDADAAGRHAPAPAGPSGAPAYAGAPASTPVAATPVAATAPPVAPAAAGASGGAPTAAATGPAAAGAAAHGGATPGASLASTATMTGAPGVPDARAIRAGQPAAAPSPVRSEALAAAALPTARGGAGASGAGAPSMAAGGAAAPQPAADAEQAASTGGARPGAPGKPYARQHLHVHDGSAGVVRAWIRDAALGADRHAAVARSLALQLLADGAQRVVVSVNGRPAGELSRPPRAPAGVGAGAPHDPLDFDSYLVPTAVKGAANP